MEGLNHRQHDQSRRNGIGLGVVVIQFDADVGGEGAKFVVGEVGPGLAGELQGTLMLET